MRTFSNSDVLEMWERGRHLHPLDRGLLALSVAQPSQSGNPGDWPLGRRNRALFDLHCTSFGSRLQGWTSCTGCGEKVEFDIDAKVLMTAHVGERESQETFSVGGECFRLPTSRDLAAVIGARDAKSPAIRLLERCRVTQSEPPDWTDTMVEEVEEKMASSDVMAEIRLALRCPACTRQWDEPLDIARFVWAEIESRARRLLWDVHRLALAYGWTEAETLSISAARRAMYLEMVQA